MKSHLSGSSLPGHSHLMAEPSNSVCIQTPPSTKGQRSHSFWSRPVTGGVGQEIVAESAV